MTKQETYAYLANRGVSYEKAEHAAVFNMEELKALALPHPECEAKNLFVRDDKKEHYYLITVKGEKRVDLREFRKAQGLRHLSFASAEEMQALLCLTPGAVTPLGLLNDERRAVTFFLDEAFLGGQIGVHPNDNTATVWLCAEDLIRLIQTHGNPVRTVSLGAEG